ncbi:MAG: TRIC cation channel family protein [Eubacteriales bacterium]|nr:TRIC cation channel family protein [Eubacteriales bacterium]
MTLFEIIGTVAFAISGAALAIKKRMDILGIVIMGMTTAVGGGIIRDLILGNTPPMAFRNPVYAFIAIGVSLFMFIPTFRNHVNERSFVFNTMDAIGLGVFTVVGLRAGMQVGGIFLSVFVGVLTGVGGGVMRDIFAGDKPSIFVKHFYACASIIGAFVSVILWNLGEPVAMFIGAVTVIVLRFLAAKYEWNLPRP